MHVCAALAEPAAPNWDQFNPGSGVGSLTRTSSHKAATRLPRVCLGAGITPSSPAQEKIIALTEAKEKPHLAEELWPLREPQDGAG